MLSRDNFTRDHIFTIKESSGADPAIIERALYAFGLLEAIRRTGMPFIFKGGTSLMLLLQKPMRLSTDIDVIVEPGTDVDSFVQKAKEIFPFHGMTEDIRVGSNKIEKRHFRFLFTSPITGRDINILLDVVFEKNPYPSLEEKPINNKLLLNDGDDLSVSIPNRNCILGDKLTAFAPNTTGIRFDQNKDLEIMKQFFDCWCLCQETDDNQLVSDTYRKVSVVEAGYRGLNITPEDALADTMRSCVCIIGRGNIRSEEYRHYYAGIRGLQGHLVGSMFNGETAAVQACEVLYLASCIRSGNIFHKISDGKRYEKMKLSVRNARKISYIRYADLNAYGYIVETFRQSGDFDMFE